MTTDTMKTCSSKVKTTVKLITTDTMITTDANAVSLTQLPLIQWFILQGAMSRMVQPGFRTHVRKLPRSAAGFFSPGGRRTRNQSVIWESERQTAGSLWPSRSLWQPPQRWKVPHLAVLTGLNKQFGLKGCGFKRTVTHHRKCSLCLTWSLARLGRRFWRVLPWSVEGCLTSPKPSTKGPQSAAQPHARYLDYLAL